MEQLKAALSTLYLWLTTLFLVTSLTFAYFYETHVMYYDMLHM